MSEGISWIGIDTAKKTFDAGLVRPGQRFPETPLREIPAQSFARTPEGAEKFVAWVRDQFKDLAGTG